MNIAIEVLVFLALIVFVAFWFGLMFILKKIKLWKYKPENDKGRRAEEFRRGSSAVPGNAAIKRSRVLPIETVNTPREDSSSGRTPSPSPRTFNPFTRR